MMAPDATGKRSLGYRGAGLIEQNLTGLHFERGPEVHDENRPQWTPMNAADRPDIRKRINDLAIAAAKKLVESGEDKFEHTIQNVSSTTGQPNDLGATSRQKELNHRTQSSNVISKKESDLDLAFATKIKDSPEFASWVLSRTKFGEHGSRVRPLDAEQDRARSANFWWKHWWCRVPELNAESETDIFIVFENIDTKARFSLHIENKKANGNFTSKQPESYKFRAKHMMNKTRYLNYTDFETILISPLVFRNNNRAGSDLFDHYISYEDIAEFIPYFRD